MIKTFTEASLRLDIWVGHEFWKPMGWGQNELEDIQANIEAGIAPKEFDAFLEYCDVHVWRRLANLSSMYEELIREWFMPTSLVLLTSYPEEKENGEADARTSQSVQRGRPLLRSGLRLTRALTVSPYESDS